MELINYLNDHFYTKQQLLNIVKINGSTLADYQLQDIMPACSYKLNLNYRCDSFFGEHQNITEIEYYAKGYASWLGILAVITNPLDVFNIFSKRYKQRIEWLKKAPINRGIN